MINKKVSEFPQWLENLEDELSEGAVKIDGYDDCICGIVERFGMENVLLYDTDTIIEKMMSLDGMSHQEAMEYFDYNIKGAWMGEGSPCFLVSSFL